MTIVDNYSRQYSWRRWSALYPLLGELRGARVLDVGCGIGDQARDLAGLGADVLGVDANREAVEHANDRRIEGARFMCGDIRELGSSGLSVDGVWASFAVAYFPRFEEFVEVMDGVVKPGGWLAITEVDDLFGHEPLDDRWRSIVEEYYEMSRDEGMHNFRSREIVCETLSHGGWSIENRRTVEDDEFGFEGPAAADVLEGWRTRLRAMMPRFVERFGDEATGLEAAFLECLRSSEHLSSSNVWFLLARRGGGG